MSGMTPINVKKTVFSPCDEVVRFVSRHLRRRTSFSEAINVLPDDERILDVGCGVGRNLAFLESIGLRAYGFDLSQVAVDQACLWLASVLGDSFDAQRYQQADIRSLPWDDNFFDHAISDSVLDSMPFEVSIEGVQEVARVVKQGGLFYCNLIAGFKDSQSPNFSGVELVTTPHEHGTYQSYFNEAKIYRLIEPFFEVVSCELHQTTNIFNGQTSGRWHVTSIKR